MLQLTQRPHVVSKTNKQHRYLPRSRNFLIGFTIVELIVVITIIGILATLTIVAYNGIQQQARDKTVLADLDGLDGIETHYGLKNSTVGKSWYSGSGIDSSLNFTPTPGNIIDVVINGTDYCIRAYNPGSASYKTLATAATRESTPGSCSVIVASVAATGTISCPSNFIVAPGSATYGTSDFCVMKYEASNVAGVATSQPGRGPWYNIDQLNAITKASAACTGCHLMSEAEWLTIAQNVVSVASNWTGGAVGSGSLYVGHNDGDDFSEQPTSADDNNGYYLTNNSAPSDQRRTFTLTNGAVIWDLAGNVMEWTTGASTGSLPGGSGLPLAYREWNSLLASPGTLSPNPNPSYGTPAASAWTSAKGMGTLYSASGSASSSMGFARGGCAYDCAGDGVFSLDLSLYYTAYRQKIGFRVAK